MGRRARGGGGGAPCISGNVYDDEAGEGVTGREDDCLPGSLDESVEQAAASIVRFIDEEEGRCAGVRKCVVELVLPELFGSMRGNVMAKEGDQMRAYDLCKRLVAAVQQMAAERCMPRRTMCLLPDDGAAALVSADWREALGVGVASVFDTEGVTRRGPAAASEMEQVDDVRLETADIVMILIPDAHGVGKVRSLVADLEGNDAVTSTVVLFNPSVVSSEVGVGLLSRRIAREIKDEWETAYCLRPTEGGAVFRQHPGDWQVFIDDEERPGRYLLLGRQLQRPSSDRIDEWLYKRYNSRDSGGGGGIGLALQAFSRFMRTLSN